MWIFCYWFLLMIADWNWHTKPRNSTPLLMEEAESTSQVVRNALKTYTEVINTKNNIFWWIHAFSFLITCLELLHFHLFLLQDPTPCSLDHSSCSPLITLALLLLLAKSSACSSSWSQTHQVSIFGTRVPWFRDFIVLGLWHLIPDHFLI